jgi:hypothetical protein
MIKHGVYSLNENAFATKKQRVFRPQPLSSTDLKKEKGFFSFRFKTTSLRPRYIGRISAALCDLGGTREGTDKGVDHAKLIGRRKI